MMISNSVGEDLPVEALTIRREFSASKVADNSFPKSALLMDHINPYRNSAKHKNRIDFSLEG